MSEVIACIMDDNRCGMNVVAFRTAHQLVDFLVQLREKRVLNNNFS